MMDPAQLGMGGRERKNVIWVLCDQLRAQALGYRGDPNVSTPNIDNLARNGMRFDAAVAGAPWCTPFRGALLTGQYPHQCGTIRTPSSLPPNTPTIAAPFKAAGYHTAWIGKWHVSGSNSREHFVTPEHRGGFDYWLGYENNNNQNECYVFGTDCEAGKRLPGYETDSLTDELLGHLKSHVGNGENYTPFFATLSVQPPHNPYVPPTNPAYGRSARNPASIQFRENVPHVARIREQAAMDLDGYYGMIENLDWNLGRIREALKAMDVDRETYIVFFSDHGDMMGCHGQWHKSSPWEESMRIPFIVGIVGGQMKCGCTDAVINHVDIGPTTLGLCGVETPGSMVGHDYSARCVPGRKLEDEEPDSAYMQQIPRKYQANTINKAWRGVAMRDGWKYVCTPGNDFMLHNTAEDPYEQANLVHSSNFQAQRARCHARLQEWIEETGDEFELPELELRKG